MLKPINGFKSKEIERSILGPPPPPGVPSRVWREGHPPPVGPLTAFYRGHQTGIHSAYLTIKQKYPRVAEELRRAFGLNEDGSITL